MQPSTVVLGADLLDEELAVEPLPHETALHVGEGDDHGVDRAALDLGLELVEGQHGAILVRRGRLVDTPAAKCT